MKAKEIITEIERLSARDYTGGKDYLSHFPKGVKKWQPLPGGSGLVWGTESPYKSDLDIYIVDPAPEGAQEAGPFVPPNKRDYSWMTPAGFAAKVARDKAHWDATKGGTMELIGKLTLSKYNGPIKNAYEVHTITVDEDYRGIGLAKALYGLVLYTMKATLVSGDSQTPGGRRNWMSLASIPGVEVKGLLMIGDEEFGPKKALPKNAPNWEKTDQASYYKNADAKIDMLMQLGFQYVGKSESRWNGIEHYFAFDVKAGQYNGGGELAPAIQNKLSQSYDKYNTLLYARWTGRQWK